MQKRLVLLILLISCLIASAQAAKVYGTIYEWSDFDKPIKNIILELYANSSRVQMNVSTTGTYVFDDLYPGNYSIKAKYFHNNILELFGEDNLFIDRDNRSINIDLLLFPPTESEYEYLGDINLTNESEMKNETDVNNYIAPILVILFIAFSAILYRIKRKKTRPKEIDEQAFPPQNIPEIIERELPSDLMELYEIILKAGGRTTQKELRKKLAFSEAKVSLMLDDLEDRGLIKKIKKGRSNIIIAENKK